MMKKMEQCLLETHGDKDYNFHDIRCAMAIYSGQNVKHERDEIRDIIYNLIPTGEVTAWDCTLAFKEILKQIDERL